MSYSIENNAGKLASTLPAKLRTHFFELTHNATPTRHSERHFRHYSAEELTCRICNQDVDSIKHLQSACAAAAVAITVLKNNLVNKSSLLTLIDATQNEYRLVAQFIKKCNKI